MTEQTMWRILDAWRKDKSSVTRSYISNLYTGVRIFPESTTSLLQLMGWLSNSDLNNHYSIQWFIDGVEVVE